MASQSGTIRSGRIGSRGATIRYQAHTALAQKPARRARAQATGPNLPCLKNAHHAASLLDGPLPVLPELEHRADRVDILRHEVGLLVHRPEESERFPDSMDAGS